VGAGIGQLVVGIEQAVCMWQELSCMSFVVMEGEDIGKHCLALEELGNNHHSYRAHFDEQEVVGAFFLDGVYRC
jgi:hypothetical protein